uniref:Uncharacterized protein n=1 Tax=Meloidogyne enterolobii TaxID=390850 RepID=A0A6V7UGE5_MELEN|nr:unnamed protein product [Meloidogyne enterolobii]
MLYKTMKNQNFRKFVMRPRLTCGWCVAYIFYFCGQHLRTNPQIDFLKLFASPDLIFNTSHI